MNIFVANLNFRTSDDDLRQLFEEFGEVDSAKIITDKATGRSRGFGFVEMSDEEAGRQAIQALNESEFGGRPLAVKEARPRNDFDRPPRRDRY